MDVSIEARTWCYKSDSFMVEVKWWVSPKDISIRDSLPSSIRKSLPENHWNVYAYIYANHPIFNQIVNDSLFNMGVDLPLHSGTSYHRWYYDKDGTVLYKKIGSDYSHFWDDRFGKISTKEKAYEIFMDADGLIEFLQRGVKCQ